MGSHLKNGGRSSSVPLLHLQEGGKGKPLTQWTGSKKTSGGGKGGPDEALVDEVDHARFPKGTNTFPSYEALMRWGGEQRPLRATADRSSVITYRTVNRAPLVHQKKRDRWGGIRKPRRSASTTEGKEERDSWWHYGKKKKLFLSR